MAEDPATASLLLVRPPGLPRNPRHFCPTACFVWCLCLTGASTEHRHRIVSIPPRFPMYRRRIHRGREPGCSGPPAQTPACALTHRVPPSGHDIDPLGRPRVTESGLGPVGSDQGVDILLYHFRHNVHSHRFPRHCRERRDYHALRCLSGVAPVTKRSGKSVLVLRRMATSKRLRDAVHHWVRVAVIHDPICKARYAALRARGHGHARSLRTVGDRLLKVACKMLENGTTFVAGHQSQGQRHAA